MPRLTALFLCLFLTSLPAWAQMDPVEAARPATIPLEVAMLYAKLLNVPPDFNALAKASPKIENTPEFGRDALITQERNALEGVFQATKRNSLITVRQNFAINSIAPSLQTIQFKDLDADSPINFEVANVTYGVFIRNAASMVLPLQAPFYRGGDWAALQKMALDKKQPMIELTLKPLGADSANFTTYRDQIVKPIMADLIEIKLYDPLDATHLLLDKRDEKAFASTSSTLENLMDDDLKDDTLPAADPGLAPKR